MRMCIAYVTASLLAAPAWAGTAPAKAPSSMTSSEIREHNKALASTDAFYIRCRKSVDTGSLVRQSRVCRTNAEWGSTFRAGNQNARDSIDLMNRGGTNNPN
jgi:hypothetical protein